MTVEQVAFGSQLRLERERRQITLAGVAESTKISRALLSSLESGDASQWPKGIYRRAFIREYASAIGLRAEVVSAEFQRLFPEVGTPDQEALRASLDAGALRLTLASEERWSPQSVPVRIVAAGLDGAVVLAISAAVAVSSDWSILPVAGVLALTYQAAATALLGGSASLALMNAAFSRRSSPDRRAHSRPSSREVLRIVPTVPRPDDRAADTPTDEHFFEDARSAS